MTLVAPRGETFETIAARLLCAPQRARVTIMPAQRLVLCSRVSGFRLGNYSPALDMGRGHKFRRLRVREFA